MSKTRSCSFTKQQRAIFLQLVEDLFLTSKGPNIPSSKRRRMWRCQEMHANGSTWTNDLWIYVHGLPSCLGCWHPSWNNKYPSEAQIFGLALLDKLFGATTWDWTSVHKRPKPSSSSPLSSHQKTDFQHPGWRSLASAKGSKCSSICETALPTACSVPEILISVSCIIESLKRLKKVTSNTVSIQYTYSIYTGIQIIFMRFVTPSFPSGEPYKGFRTCRSSSILWLTNDVRA